MAEISDGTYIIVSALNTSRAIDCKYGSDLSGANVWIYSKNNTDAQYITVVTNSDGSQRLLFTLSGKSIDIANGNISSGTNVQQYANNDTRAQKWDIVADGKTVTIGSTSYDTYVIKSHANNNLALDVSGGQAANGTNVQIYTVNGTDAQRWAFLPQDALPAGTYLIRSMLNTNAVLDVSGGSTANRANVQLWGDNGTNAQVWISHKKGDGLYNFENANSGKYMNVAGGSTADGTNVWQFAYDGTTAMQWYPEQIGQVLINGCTVPTYCIHYECGGGKVLDAAGGSSKNRTNIQIYEYNGTKAQQWAFQPYSMIAGALPVPSNIRVDGKTVISANNLSEITPSWRCSGTAYQVRYRIRVRKIGQELGGWGGWHSIYDGTTANDGWGDIGSANCTTENTALKVSPTDISFTAVDNATIDYEEMQIEVRRYESDYNGTGRHAHGNSCTQLIKLVWKPTLEITQCIWRPQGLMLTYSSDYKRDGNTINVKKITCGGKTLCENQVFTGQPYTGWVEIPQSELNFIPDDGASITANVEIRTDASYASDTIASTVAYNSAAGLTVSPTYTENDDYTVSVTFTASDEDHVYLLYDDSLTECSGSDGNYTVIPPLNKTYRIFVTQWKSDGSWGMVSMEMSAIGKGVYVWNWDDGCAVLKCSENNPPDYSVSITPDSSSETTTGREHPVYSFGNSYTCPLDVSGSYTDLVKYGNYEAFDALAKAGHVTFRSPEGKIHSTAITQVKRTRSRPNGRFGEWGSVSVSQSEESL